MATQGPTYDYLFKILLVGDSEVGKSSILMRWAEGLDTPTAFIPTIGVDFRMRIIKLADKTVKLQVWDTAGQERFRTITSSYYRGCRGILLVYDITNEESFKNLEQWLSEIKLYATDNVQVIVIGNDIPKERQVSSERGRMFAAEHGLKFMETNIVTGENVDLAFETLAKDIKNTILNKY